MPTDHEFNDRPYPGHDLQQTIGACRADQPCPHCQARIKDTAELEKELTKELNTTYVEAVAKRLAEERIENFKPTGLMNQPGIAAYGVRKINPLRVRMVLVNHRALAQATTAEIDDLMEKLRPWLKGDPT